jgi:hypothetical protein
MSSKGCFASPQIALESNIEVSLWVLSQELRNTGGKALS